MKEGWVYTTIDDCCNVNYGTRVVRKNVTGDKYPVYGGGGETFRMDDYNREDCLVISRFAMSKQCTRLVKGKFFLNDSGLSLTPKDEEVLLRELLERFILASNDTIYSYGRGSAQRNLNMNEFRRMPVSYPKSLSEQAEIVTYLDTSFAKIDAIKANAEKELEEAKKLFAAALNEAMTPKEGWVEKKMEDIVDKNTNISYGIVQPGDEYNNGVPVVRPIDLGPKIISLNSQLKRTNPANSIAYKRTILNGKEILMCVRGTTGVVSLTDKTLIDCNVTRGIVPLKIDNDDSRCFVYYALLSTRPNTFILQNTKGAALKQINIADVKRIPIWIPSLADQHSIVTHLDTLSEKVRQLQSNYEKISSECDTLKQAILRDTFE